MKSKPISIKKVNALLYIYYFLAIIVGLYFSNTSGGQDYFLLALWLAFVGVNILITSLLAEWIKRLEAKISSTD
jgi:hypothetical protein